MDPVGKAGLLTLVPYLRGQGFDVRVPDYGLITALETKIVNPLLFRTLRPYIEPGDVYIGHSNGGAIGYDLVKDGAPFAGLVLIDAALECDITLPTGMWADVYYNEGDDATVAAQVAAAFGIVDPVWGEMGHKGYIGTNPLIESRDCGHSLPLPVVSGHSDIFSDGKYQEWDPVITEHVVQRLQRQTRGSVRIQRALK